MTGNLKHFKTFVSTFGFQVAKFLVKNHFTLCTCDDDRIIISIKHFNTRGNKNSVHNEKKLVEVNKQDALHLPFNC